MIEIPPAKLYTLEELTPEKVQELCELTTKAFDQVSIFSYELMLDCFSGDQPGGLYSLRVFVEGKGGPIKCTIATERGGVPIKEFDIPFRYANKRAHQCGWQYCARECKHPGSHLNAQDLETADKPIDEAEESYLAGASLPLSGPNLDNGMTPL